MSRFPWWGSVLLAIACYFGLKYGAGLLLPPESPFAGLLPLLAPLTAMFFLLLAGKQLYDGDPDEGETDGDVQEEKKKDDCD